MKAKLTDTSAGISAGGRADRFWKHKPLKPRAASMVVGGDPDSVNLQHILTTYQMKGFEFGNWLSNNDRYDRIVAAEVSLRDLAKIIGTKNLGINQQVGLAFGARGVGSALAHYEPGSNMINLTKVKGFGSLAHEYGHALDYNLGSFIDQHKNYAALSGGRSTSRTLSDNTGGQFRWYMNKIVDAIKRSDSYDKMSQDSSFNDDYWHRRSEIWARYFEQYVCYKLGESKVNNTFLSKRWVVYIASPTYLSQKDFLPLVKITDAFCNEMAKFLDGKTTSLVTKAYPTLEVAATKSATTPKTTKATKPKTKKTTTAKPKKSKAVSIKTIDHAKAFSMLWPFVSKDKMRPRLNGVFYDPKGRMVASDAQILAIVNDMEIPASLKGSVMNKKGQKLDTEYLLFDRVLASFKQGKATTIDLDKEIAKVKAVILANKSGTKKICPIKIAHQTLKADYLLKCLQFLRKFDRIATQKLGVDNRNACTFEAKNGFCIIMPLLVS